MCVAPPSGRYKAHGYVDVCSTGRWRVSGDLVSLQIALLPAPAVLLGGAAAHRPSSVQVRQQTQSQLDPVPQWNPVAQRTQAVPAPGTLAGPEQ